ncbi:MULTISPECIES: LytR C-terminal domain-containing protein [unclassified Bifidobacterium]|uniref:LytR C-terminal domain-containing protein n=1 Tax=unclassified Bifidobacterium TaxID=2608897 RepID=UPI0023FA20A5|nr:MULTISPECIES: LytR C-terminal domain-containing protein [unclassified Bifidobacterium]WEV65851.1 LytR C-terminal domain-containing protein [Bifidobacterium sp. ESL0764]WEV75362.1 LytR C-terminal domain-containing protein [Bifidobacterium sp. ESL0800]
MQQFSDERKARKEYVHHRQVRVFSTIAAVLVVALVVSFLVFFRTIGKSNADVPQAQTNYGAPLVCASEDPKKSPATYQPNGSVEVNVLNGTKSVGLAGAVGEALRNRNFNVSAVGDFPSRKVERTTIYYGVNNMWQAYTVYSNFTDAELVMDSRTDGVVSVAIGSTFSDLTPKKSVPPQDSKIKNIPGCTLPSKIDKAKLPKDFRQKK